MPEVALVSVTWIDKTNAENFAKKEHYWRYIFKVMTGNGLSIGFISHIHFIVAVIAIVIFIYFYCEVFTLLSYMLSCLVYFIVIIFLLLQLL